MAIKRGCDAWSRLERDVLELPVVLVPIQHFALPKACAQALALNFGIDVAIGHKEIRPTVIIYIDKQRAPAQKLCVGAEPGCKSHIGESAIAVVVIEGSGVI